VNLRKKISRLLALSFVFIILFGKQKSFAAPQNTFDGFVRVGLEQHFLQRPHINVYSPHIEVGIFMDGDFFVMHEFFTNSHFTIMPHQSHVGLSTNGEFLFVLDHDAFALQLRSVCGITNLGVRQYRGIIEFGRFGGGGVTAVNIVHMDEYLFSVVPSEMPAMWHMEALKAQVVAARTFAMNRITNSPRTPHYQLCDTVFSQVYSGVSREHERTNYAVLATSGLVLTHNGRFITAAFSSCAGGYTANSEDVWVSGLPYLRAVQELYPSEQVPWERTITHSQLQQLLTASGRSVGTITSVELHKNNVGRVMQFRIIGTNGVHTLEREAIRSFFGSLEIGGGSLRSRIFTIQNNQNNASEPFAHYILSSSGVTQGFLQNITIMTALGSTFLPNASSIITAHGIQNIPNATQSTQPNIVSTTDYSFTLVGRGFGHGVGMSQWGARAMAENGHSFVSILLHYYTDVEMINIH